jgi:hypothetical protein
MDLSKLRFYLELLSISGTAGLILTAIVYTLMGKTVSGLSLALTAVNVYIVLTQNETFDELARKWGWKK